jgi:GNAT superfamily N-acetyltransferase
MTIGISELAAQDLLAWEPLWQGYLAFYKSSLSPDATRTAFDRLVDPAEPMGGFLARNPGGKPVGMVNWITHRTTWTIGDYCYLQDLFTVPAARGTGVGRALIEAVYAKADTLGCSRVYWLTHETNVNAMQLYDRIAEKSGFLQYEKAL